MLSRSPPGRHKSAEKQLKELEAGVVTPTFRTQPDYRAKRLKQLEENKKYVSKPRSSSIMGVTKKAPPRSSSSGNTDVDEVAARFSNASIGHDGSVFADGHNVVVVGTTSPYITGSFDFRVGRNSDGSNESDESSETPGRDKMFNVIRIVAHGAITGRLITAQWITDMELKLTFTWPRWLRKLLPKASLEGSEDKMSTWLVEFTFTQGH